MKHPPAPAGGPFDQMPGGVPASLRRRPIVTRLVLAVAAAMGVVLLLTATLVYWRVEFALNRQLNQDLKAWNSVVDRAVSHGAEPPAGTPGLKFQIYDRTGVLDRSSLGLRRLASPTRCESFCCSWPSPTCSSWRRPPSWVTAPLGRRSTL